MPYKRKRTKTWISSKAGESTKDPMSMGTKPVASASPPKKKKRKGKRNHHHGRSRNKPRSKMVVQQGGVLITIQKGFLSDVFNSSEIGRTICGEFSRFGSRIRPNELATAQ